MENEDLEAPPIRNLILLQMSDNGNHTSSRRAARDGDDPMTHLRKTMDRARSDLNQSLQRSKRALAEADAALKIGSR